MNLRMENCYYGYYHGGSIDSSNRTSTNTSCCVLFKTIIMRLLVSSLLVLHLSCTAVADLVLSDKIMGISKTAATLSALAYEENPSEKGYDSLAFFDNEPDQALVVEQDGYCFAAFRGTTLTWEDWQQNLVLGKEEVCSSISGNATACCSTRRGFYEAYNTAYAKAMEAALRACAASCKLRDECVVLTGHSQGGAIAAVAALYMPDLNPYVITFGQPPTIDAPCDLITSSRWYRYVNTKAAEVLSVGIVYDPVPFAPNMGTDYFGHFILLSDDVTGIAYIGLDAQDYFGPLNVNGFEAHSMISANGTYPGYLDRIDALMTAPNTSHPVRTTGYIPGSLCSQGQECLSGECARETKFSFLRCVGNNCDNDNDCDDSTGRCDSGMCLPKQGSCQKCDENSDCLHGHCSWKFLCTGSDGLMDDECACNFGTDCHSGRCEGFFLNRVCEAALALGSECNENSDCVSGHCSWSSRCVSGDWWSKHKFMENETTSTGAMGDGNESEVLPTHWKVLLLVITMVFLVLGGIFLMVKKSRRQGYEQIPAELTV